MSSDFEDPTNQVRESCKYVVSRAKHVHIDREACSKLADKLHTLLLTQKSSAANTWLGANGLHPKTSDARALSWIFVVDTLNFCFWSPLGEQPFNVLWKGRVFTGYWSLCAAVNRAVDEGLDLLDAHIMSRMDEMMMRRIFRSDNGVSIPLTNERAKVLKEAGEVLLKRFGGSFENLLSEADWNATQIVKLVIDNFPSFRDEMLYGNDYNVYFYKRAQILAADCWACTGGKVRNVDRLTMFADYRVPQCLVYFNAVQYGEDLLARLKSGVVLNSGSREEIEIRACSILAVEQIREDLEKLKEQNQENIKTEIVSINSVVIDFELWNHAKDHSLEMADIPIHRTYSCYY